MIGRENPKQIGFARLITDEVTLAWLEDVYILPEYRKRGLATWLTHCIKEVLVKKSIGSAMALSSPHTLKMYEDNLGMKEFVSRRNPALKIIIRRAEDYKS